MRISATHTVGGEGDCIFHFKLDLQVNYDVLVPESSPDSHVDPEITHHSLQSPLSYAYTQKSLTFSLEAYVLPIIHVEWQFTC